MAGQCAGQLHVTGVQLRSSRVSKRASCRCATWPTQFLRHCRAPNSASDTRCYISAMASGQAERQPAVYLFPADDSDSSQRAFTWLLNTVYHNGDDVHIVHVIPRIKFQASGYAVPAVDYIPQIDRDKYEAAVQKAEEFIVKRFLSRFPAESSTTPIVHIIKSETDTESVGHIICQKAEDIKATIVVMANHNKSLVTEFFMGSVSQYVMHHCKRPVLIAKGI